MEPWAHLARDPVRRAPAGLLPTNADGDYLAVRRGPQHLGRYVQIAPLDLDRWAVEAGGGGAGLRQVYDARVGASSPSTTRLTGITREPEGTAAYAFDAAEFRLTAQQVIELTAAWVRRGVYPAWAETVPGA